MPKKTFKNNPALEFISSAGAAEKKEKITVQVTELEQKPQTIKVTPTKITGRVPEGYKLNPLYIETKSKRLQLVLQPSLLARVKERAKGQGLSVNEYIHRILDEATKREE